MTHPFPEQEPEFEVEAIDDGPTEVLCRDAQGYFVELEVGAKCLWSFYDWPERALTGVTETTIVGRALVDGLECLDGRHRDVRGDEGESRWIYHVADETLRYVRFEHTNDGGLTKIEEVDMTPFPLRLRVGDRWSGHELYTCGEERRCEGQANHRIVEGPFRVRVAEREFDCVRATSWTLRGSGEGHTLAELYVADFGRTVLFQRYNGPTWHNYEALAGLPEREHEGVVYRLWYGCIPDHALVAP